MCVIYVLRRRPTCSSPMGGPKGALKVTCVTCEVHVGARRPGLNVSPTASSTGIFTTSSPGSALTVPKKGKHPVSSSCVEGKCRVDVRSGWADWVETTARQEELRTRRLQPRPAEKHLLLHASSLQALVSGPLYQVPVTSNMLLINEAVSVCLAMNSLF